MSDPQRFWVVKDDKGRYCGTVEKTQQEAASAFALIYEPRRTWPA